MEIKYDQIKEAFNQFAQNTELKKHVRTLVTMLIDAIEVEKEIQEKEEGEV